VETLYSAYNEGSKRVLSPRLSVVDAAREPLKVLKILMEGLAVTARNGIWLVNFKGIPVARSHSAFDLVYLDDEHRVVHAIEITQSSEFTPFKGDPSSALILPPTSLIRSKTFTGDRLTVSAVGQPAGEPMPGAAQVPAPAPALAPAPAPKRVAPQPSRVVPAIAAKTFNVPAAHGQDLRAPAGASSGRLMRSGSLALKRSPETMPSVSPALAQEAERAPEAKVVPISVATAQTQETAVAEAMPIAETAPAQVPATALVPKRRTKAGPQSVAVAEPVAEQAAVEDVPTESPVEVHASSNGIGVQPKGTKQPAKRVKKRDAQDNRRWDVQLLYSLFPELHPSYRPEFQAPVVNFTKDVLERNDGKASRKIQLLSWLYPDLELDTVHVRQREHRRAPRIPVPGLVGFYFSGGHSQPHEIRNLSVMGFYMITEERWLPGTVIRVTLQIIDSPGDDPRDTLTVLSRVVNWGPDGGGFEFVMPGFVD
jgi:hypothetical protein